MKESPLRSPSSVLPRLDRRLAAVRVGILVAASLTAAASESPVTAELFVPPAETHVIGDATLLFWRFHNHSAEPLAFMWEGCCRLNGRLTVTSATGQPVELLPPGQALAHMFAKAERLDPGTTAGYDTRVSDWVQLSTSGTYQLQGRYTGVLPDQFPQVPKDLPLWRAATTTPPIPFSVLSVDDYLAERPARQQRRGLELELTGDTAVQPPDPLRLVLRIHNSSDLPQALVWPDDLQFWVVDVAGQRVRNVPTSLEGVYEELAIPAGTDWVRPLALDPIRFFEGVPFADYRVFIDLAARLPDRCRVPSDDRPLTWRLNQDTVASLVQQAARGSRVGFRNAPLKLLRVYLGEVGPQLRVVADEAQDPAIRALAQELWLASRLKPIAPKPGRVDWPLQLDRAGELTLAEPRMRAVAEAVPGGDSLTTLIGLQRHLGWEIGIALRPEPDVTVGQIVATARQLEGRPGLMAGVVRAGAIGALTNTLGGLTVRADPVPAAALVTVENASPGLVVRQAPARLGLDDLRRQPDQGLASAAELTGWLENLPPGTLVQVEAPEDLTWEGLAHRLEPLLRRSVPGVLSPLPDSP